MSNVSGPATSGDQARSDAQQALRAERYDQMLRLADLFDDAGEQMRAWARTGSEVLADADVSESAALSPATYAEAEEELRAATSGRNGLLSRSLELDADALVLRATVLTYQWIDDLRAAAYLTLGAIAGKAIGYLAPEVALGGAIVSAGLIETDALDRETIAAYLNELAEANPDLMDHITTGGGLLDSLQMRSLLAAGVLAGDGGGLTREGGLRAAGVEPLDSGFGAALRDTGVGLDAPEGVLTTTPPPSPAAVPRGLEELLTRLAGTRDPVRIVSVGAGRHIVYLTGAPMSGARLVGGDVSPYVDDVVRTIAAELGDHEAPAHVLLVGCGSGAVAAVTIASRSELPGFVVDRVVAADAPATQMVRVPAPMRVLAFEDRADPVALLGSLVNASATNRTTVVYDSAADLLPQGVPSYVGAGRAADASGHADLLAEVAALRELGYLLA